MLLRTIGKFVHGVVRIEISGTAPEKFINLCMLQGIFLWGISKRSERLQACVYLQDFFVLRPLLRKSRCHIRVIGYNGLPFLWKRLQRRKMLWVGIAAFFILLHYLASYIWFVDVAGVKTLDREKILAVAQAQGLQPGVPRQRLQPKLLENHLRSALPELAWVGVSAQGSRVVIEVVEKTAAQEEDKAPAHIVAGKDGIIVETIALAGTAVVGRGTTVKRGDIVIRGEVAETEVPGTQAKEPVPLQKIIRAKGIVKARVWYEGYGEAQTEEELWQRTGTYVSAVTARIGPWQAVLNRPAGQPFSHYELETVQKIFPNWRNSEFTVESTIHTYYELQASKLIRSESEARELARERALASVRQKIPEAAQILANDVTVMKTADPKLVRVTARVETIEDIGEAQLITNP
ncbi:MAG: sporulation protein YqfD [Sporomusaceae bacterium]|nr:sporulation protein YqfD [Sporomusaceae bacterium]